MVAYYTTQHDAWLYAALGWQVTDLKRVRGDDLHCFLVVWK